ncbi:MAG: hypothetical protein IKW77_12175 [Salinivirgaceae bacterium]|nr:hypothetical protein [Salinivirgaceae bacterium]
MKFKKYILLIVCFLAFHIANAQDTIMLMKGKRIIVNNSKIDVSKNGDTIVTYQTLAGKSKSKRASRVFSVSTTSGEQVLYVPDTAAEEPNVAQMRRFLQGKADFSNGFSWGFFAGGVAATAAGIAIPTLNFKIGSNNANIPIGMLVPFGYVFVVGNTTKSVEKLKAKYPDMPDDEYYIFGAQAAISQKRMRDGALGVLTGGIIWIVASEISN